MEKIQKKLEHNPRMPTKYKILFVAICVVAFVAISGAKAANAASLYFSPSSGSYEVGKTFSASIYVSSADQAMNAASGIISFPQDKLEVATLSKTGSIFALWVQEPSFSNPPAGGQGTVNFEGIVLNPGFTGASGKVITINFKAKSAGTAVLNFSSGSILANDGVGTNILSGMGSANYQLSAGPGTPAEQITETKPTATAGVPAAPQVFSSTLPDSAQWYNNKNPQFSWTLPAGVNGASFYFSQSPTSNPGPVSDGLLAFKSYENVEDGIWYFHVKFKNSYGWGPITHFKVQIDTTPPTPFEIKFIDGKETDNPRPTVIFDTTDSLSGIDYYKVKIGEGDFFNVAPEIIKSNPHTLPLQAPGKRNILVQAFDKAGNYAVATEEFIIKPLKEPVFAEYVKELESGQALTVKGQNQYPNSQIIIWLQKEKDEPKSFTVQSDQNGKFTFIADERLPDGIYQLWTEVVDDRGARSLPGGKITVVVAKPTIFRIGTWAVSFLSVVVPLIALIILLLLIIFYGWHKFSLLMKRLRKEVREAESTLHEAFDLLKEDIEKQVKMLEKARTKRQLTEEEEKVIKRLKKDLDDAEKFVRKEIKDIERAVK